MSKFTRFMKANKIKKENEKHVVTKSLRDENGNPLEWEFTHITSKENEAIREESMSEVLVNKRKGIYRPKLQTALYIQKMIVASVVVPDLYDAELQDSYGVKTPEDLLMEMVDDPGEYNDLSAYVQQFQGFDVTLDEKVDEAKN